MDGEAHQEKHAVAMDSSQSKVSKEVPRSKEALSSKAKEVKEEENSNRTTSKSVRKPNATRAKSGRTRRRDQHGKSSEDSGLKLVLRLLPPNLSEDQFLDTLKPEIGDMKKFGVVEWYYVQGHYSANFRSEPTYSRCYFSFNDMEHLEKLVKKVQPIKFVDDKDNAANAVIKVSAYNKRLVAGPAKGVQSKQSLEGTINGDPLFQTFMKSLKTLEERTSDFSYAEVSILKPLEKELAKRKAVETEIQKKTEMALVALTGDKEKKSKSKGKKKNKKKDKTAKDEAGDATAEPTASASRKRKKSKKKANAKADVKANTAEKNNNVVILEAAGRKELQRRKKLQMEKEKLTGNADTVKSKRKPRSKGKQTESHDDAQKVKLLKREIAEHS